MDPERLLGLADVLAQTSLSKSGLYAKTRAGTFPPPVPVSAGRRAWRQIEVQKWIAQRIEERDSKRARSELKAL